MVSYFISLAVAYLLALWVTSRLLTSIESIKNSIVTPWRFSSRSFHINEPVVQNVLGFVLALVKRTFEPIIAVVGGTI